MKKKFLIIGVTVLLISICLIVCIIFNKKELSVNENSSLDKQKIQLNEFFDDKYAKLYWDYMNSEEFKKKNETIGKYTFIDLNFDKINELVFETSNENNKIYTIYTIENNQVVLKDTSEAKDIIMSSNELNFYCWLFRNYDESANREIINEKQWVFDNNFNKIDITNNNYISTNIPYSTVNYDLSQSEEEQIASFIGIFQNGQQLLEKNELIQTYEIAKSNSDIKDIILKTENRTNNNDETVQNDITNNNTSPKQKLSEVVQIGDYVNYMNSDTFWRVLNIKDNGSVVLICITGTENFDNNGRGSSVYSLYYDRQPMQYKSEFSKLTCYVPHFTDLKESYKKTHGVDVGVSSVLEGDLYNIGLEYYVVEEDMEWIESATTFVGTNGRVYSNTVQKECFLRPTIFLKEDVNTTGKNEKGAWVLVN